MSLKDILVHLDGAAPSKIRLALAAQLARRHAAHLIGLHVIDVMAPVIAAAGDGGGIALADFIAALREEALDKAKAIEADFNAALGAEGIAGEWRIAEGNTAELVSLHTRYSDLAVLGQQEPESGPSARIALEAALFGSGRPVLVVPYAGRFPTVGQRVLIGWNASREASRAVHDALPLLKAAASVTILAINPQRGLGRHGEEPGADIARHLARHGVRLEVEHSVVPEITDGEALLNRAAELSADLLVVGAYGHSRLRELVLGGVTRTLLGQMTLPVLMAH